MTGVTPVFLLENLFFTTRRRKCHCRTVPRTDDEVIGRSEIGLRAVSCPTPLSKSDEPSAQGMDVFRFSS